MIEVRNLVKRYGDNVALDNISFTVEEGLIYGFLGPNGAGKSTTMNIMTGYLAATDGEVIINGHNITEEPEAAKKCIGYLPEMPPLYTDMTVLEYLKFVAALKKIPAKERAAAVSEAMKITRLEDVGERLIANLSKGYKQRVGLAQAVLGMPEIIILDEPTVGLDPKQIIEIRDLIRDLAEKHTVILSSHILSEIQELCDKIIIIHQGRLIANGTPAELEEALGNSAMKLTLKMDDEKAAVNIVSGIEGVENVAVVNNADGEITLNLKLTRGVDVRENIFNACVSNGCVLLMMKATEFSLERVFLELTKERKKVRRRVKKKADPEAADNTVPQTEGAAAETVSEASKAETVSENTEKEGE